MSETTPKELAFETLLKYAERADERMEALRLPQSVMIMVCSFKENISSLVISYYAQVCNGGHLQWMDNGYIDQAGDLMTIFKLIGTESTNRCVELVEKTVQLSLEANRIEEEDWEEYVSYFETLDDAFYEGLDEKMLIDVASYIAKLQD